MSTSGLVWLRSDLRLADNPALARACEENETVACAFCFEPRLLSGQRSSPARNAYLLDCLAELDEALERRGGDLFFRQGPPEREMAELAAGLRVRRVYWQRQHTPAARARDKRVTEALRQAGIEPIEAPSTGCAEVDGIESKSGGPYRVFTPFHRAWSDAARRELADAPKRLAEPEAAARLRRGRPPARRELGIDAGAERVARGARPGERSARALLERATSEVARGYEADRDRPDLDATTRLSVPLHFGSVSAREVESRLAALGGPGARALRRQLAWRDFHLHVIHHFPEVVELELQPRFRGMSWQRDEESLAAWRAGTTGVPMVDAGMRQLLAEGWMHNRARLVCASYLTKHLLIDWRLGEQHFMRHLLDGDTAQNNGNWQWSASVGADAVPYFRVLNPARQQRRFDPEGGYVRRWVPELERLPNEHLAEPWLAPADVQREAGCVIGSDYPEPIVGLREGREHALAAFSAQTERAA